MACIKFAVVILGIASVFAPIACEEQAEEEWICLGQKMDKKPKEDKAKAYEKCGEELKVDDAAVEKNPDVMRCVTTCAYKKLGVLTSDDKLDMAVFGKRVDNVFPEKARAGIKADVKKCADGLTAKLTNDDNCKNHDEYQQCMFNSYEKNCSE